MMPLFSTAFSLYFINTQLEINDLAGLSSEVNPHIFISIFMF